MEDFDFGCRYDAKTILRLLQEMAYYSEIKMDWSELVKKTTTGITNAREYQLLWRHLSYQDPLVPVEDDAQPLVLFFVLINCFCLNVFKGYIEMGI